MVAQTGLAKSSLEGERRERERGYLGEPESLPPEVPSYEAITEFKHWADRARAAHLHS